MAAWRGRMAGPAVRRSVERHSRRADRVTGPTPGNPSFRIPLPTLSDGGVLLRPFDARDIPVLDAGMHDPDVLRWIGPPERPAPDILVQIEERWAQGWPTLAICELDGTCVGKVWMSFREG